MDRVLGEVPEPFQLAFELAKERHYQFHHDIWFSPLAVAMTALNMHLAPNQDRSNPFEMVEDTDYTECEDEHEDDPNCEYHPPASRASKASWVWVPPHPHYS